MVIAVSLHCRFLFIYPVVDSLGEGSGNPLQYSCLETPMDRGVQ